MAPASIRVCSSASLATPPSVRWRYGVLLEPKLAEASAQARPHRLPGMEATVLLLPGRERLLERPWHVVEPSGGLERELLAEYQSAVSGSRCSQANSTRIRRPPGRDRPWIRSTAASRSWMWCSDRLATTASNGPGSSSSSRLVRRKTAPSGASGSIARTSYRAWARVERELDRSHTRSRGRGRAGAEALRARRRCPSPVSWHWRPNSRLYTGCMKRVALLGATGSIGTQALEVVGAHPELELCAIAVGSQADEARRIASEHGVRHVSVGGDPPLDELVRASKPDVVLNASWDSPGSRRR